MYQLQTTLVTMLRVTDITNRASRQTNAG